MADGKGEAAGGGTPPKKTGAQITASGSGEDDEGTPYRRPRRPNDAGQRSKQSSNSSRAAFEGEEPKLQGNVFSAGPSKAQVLKKAKEILLSYAGAQLDPSVEASLGAGELAYLEEEPEAMAMPGTELASKYKSGITKKMAVKECTDFRKYEKQVKKDLQAMYYKIWGQCAAGLQDLIQAEEQYQQLKKKKDSIGLLNLIEALVPRRQHDDRAGSIGAGTLSAICGAAQEENEKVSGYIERMKVLFGAAERTDEALLPPPMLKWAYKEICGKEYEQGKYTKLTKEKKEEVKEKAAQARKSIIIMKKAGPYRFGPLQKYLRQQYAMSSDQYPAAIAGARKTLISHEPSNWWQRYLQRKEHLQQQSPRNKGVPFAQQGKAACWRCGRSGCFSQTCGEKYHKDGAKITTPPHTAPPLKKDFSAAQGAPAVPDCEEHSGKARIEAYGHKNGKMAKHASLAQIANKYAQSNEMNEQEKKTMMPYAAATQGIIEPKKTVQLFIGGKEAGPWDQIPGEGNYEVSAGKEKKTNKETETEEEKAGKEEMRGAMLKHMPLTTICNNCLRNGKSTVLYLDGEPTKIDPWDYLTDEEKLYAMSRPEDKYYYVM